MNTELEKNEIILEMHPQSFFFSLAFLRRELPSDYFFNWLAYTTWTKQEKSKLSFHDK